MMNAAFEEKQRRNRFQQVHQFNVNQPTFAFNPVSWNSRLLSPACKFALPPPNNVLKKAFEARRKNIR